MKKKKPSNGQAGAKIEVKKKEDDFTQEELEALYDGGIITPSNPRKLPPGTRCKYCQNYIEYRWIRYRQSNEQTELVHVHAPNGPIIDDGLCKRSPLSKYLTREQRSEYTKSRAPEGSAKREASEPRTGSLRDKTLTLLLEAKKPISAEEIIKSIGGRPGTRSPLIFVKPLLKSLEKAGHKIEEPKAGLFQMKK